MIIGDTLEKNRRFYPDRLAVTDGKRRITYREFTGNVFRTMHVLFHLKLAKGDRVACLLSNVPEIMELYFAVPFSGMIIVPLNYRLSPEELRFQLEDSGAKVLVVEKQFLEKIALIRSDLKGIKEFIIVRGNDERCLNYEEIRTGYDPEIPDGIEVYENDIADINYTSGTTGKPKGVMLTHKNMLSQVYGYKGFSGRWAGDGTDVIMASYPMFHVGVIGNFAGLVMGMQNVIINFDPQTIYAVLEREKVTKWCTAPIMLEMTFTNGMDPRDFDLSHLHFIASAGQPQKLTTAKKAFEVFPNPELYFTVGLGLSETFTWIGYTHITRKSLSKVETLMKTLPVKTEHVPAGMCGPLPHVDLKIVDDNGQETDAGKTGEVIVRGDNVMKGYWKNPGATREAIKDGWFHTGDMAMRHPEDPACHFVVGRKKEMIVTGAENVYPAEVELPIQEHPAVSAVVVFGVPDDKWGETVKAAVVLKPGAETTEKDIIEFCRKRIASYKKPTSVYFVSDFPRNTFGKILKNELVRMAMEGCLKRD